MKHRIKKIKVKKGYNANKRTLRHLTYVFIREGKLTTTVKRAKYVKSQIDILVHKAKSAKNSDINQIKKFLPNKEIITYLLEKVVPEYKNIDSGYLNSKIIETRKGDGANLMELKWTKPIDPLKLKKIILKEKKKSGNKLIKTIKKDETNNNDKVNKN